ncbi:MAG: TatD family hydrolase [Halobacteriota archaeon]
MRWHLFDTHCHIDMPAFDLDRQIVINRALDARIALINSGITLRSNQATKDLLQHENVFAAYGLSPLNLDEKNQVSEFIRRNADSAIALGEVGLDFFHVESEHQRVKQEDTFRIFIRLSRELNLPLIIHSRDAEERVFKLVNRADQAIYHCYGGNAELLKAIADCGHYISIPTRVCKSAHHQKLVKSAPQEAILVETDSPYQAAHRGRNEPALVRDAVVAISRIWDMKLEDTASILVKNTYKAFNLV